MNKNEVISVKKIQFNRMIYDGITATFPSKILELLLLVGSGERERERGGGNREGEARGERDSLHDAVFQEILFYI